jgi:N-acyl-D-amino-acid deacylase
MRRILGPGLLLVILASSAGGQVSPYNPLTGGASPRPGYNPYLGPGQPAGAPNPYLGGDPRGRAVNPFTGQAVPTPMVLNPLTGTWQAGRPQPSGAQPAAWPTAAMPVTGKAGPGLEDLDAVVKAIMERHGIPGGALAIAKDGKLIYARAFGWADLAAALEAHPLTMFSLASVSKPITALAILLLIEQGKLGLDDRAFDLLKHIRALPGARVDPRLRQITIRQLLNHTGGWDRKKNGDPINWSPQIARTLRVPMPISEEQFLTYMWSLPLDFAPGTRMEYSNVGYIILGQVVEKVSGQPYEQFVWENVLKPAGVRYAFLNRGGQRNYLPGEARSYLAGSNVLLPPMNLPMVKAAGGWRASAVELVRLLTALDGSRGKPLLKPATFAQMLAPPPPPLKPRANGTHNGLGWPAVLVKGQTFSYAHDGEFNGARAFMKRSPTGINWVLLFNVNMDPDQVDAQILARGVQEIRRRLDQIQRFPKVDYFEEFR